MKEHARPGKKSIIETMSESFELRSHSILKEVVREETEIV